MPADFSTTLPQIGTLKAPAAAMDLPTTTDQQLAGTGPEPTIATLSHNNGDQPVEDIYCIRQRISGRQARMYRRRVSFTVQDDAQITNLACLSFYSGSTSGLSLINFNIKKEVATKLELPSPFEGYIAFDIMVDEQPHPVPWVGCPSVGP